METIRLNEVGAEVAAQRAAEILRDGGVVLYPTDTLYGLGADALSDAAVAKIKRIKGRDEKKPIHAIVANLSMVERYAHVSETGRVLARALWPGPLTIIFEKKSNFNSGIVHDISTFGARAANDPVCLAIANTFGAPYTGTSANRSGEKPKRSIESILVQLGGAVSEINLAIDAGELPERLPSTVIDISHGKPVVLREGAILESEIWEVLRPAL